MKNMISAHRRSRVLRLAVGCGALFLLLWRLESGRQNISTSHVEIFIWGAVFLTTILLVWREKNLSAAQRHAAEEDARFIAAAENSSDAFLLLEAVCNSGGTIVDFRFVYANAHAENILNTSRAQLIHQDLCVLFPAYRTSGLFDAYRRVEMSGETYIDESAVHSADGKQIWLRQRVAKLGRGIAISIADITEIKAGEERYRSLSNFSNSVFENAPFSIIEVDTAGIIRAMNSAAERLTGYKREDVVGKLPITSLHDPIELSRRSDDNGDDAELNETDEPAISGFELLTAKAAQGESDEREWTYVRDDGSTLPVHVAINSVKDGHGEISGFIAIASDITERKQLMTYLNHMASHDQLTGLPGRTLLRERIAEAIEKAMLHGRKVAVFVIDLDHFKRMNDSLGHRAGDEIIVGMAERMRQSLRRSDTLGRLGGDEFVVVMPHIATLSDVERCAKRLVDRVSSTAVVGDMEVNLTASVGVCVYPDFAEDVDSLLERADAATYAAKGNGRNQFQIFSEAMLKESQKRLSMDTALRHALVREELFLHYQPIVSLTTGRVIGMESLLRWHHPTLGVISPATFIPLAEETGLIIAIGEWALKRSCLQAKTLCDELGIDLSLSVNLSPRQFEQPNLLQVVEEALAGSGLPAKNLQLELTENTLMINSASNLEKLQHIRQLGSRVAIDDFGTGFCSFSYLLQYPVDRLKIDQSFVMKAVTEPNAATVVRTIVAMSHHLGIKIIAEGVETPEQLRFLAQRNCDEAQGYYFSRPVAVAAFATATAEIHKLFDERRLLEEIRLASANGEDPAYEPDQELERQGSQFRSVDKHIVM